jgi:hypothetical protein
MISHKILLFLQIILLLIFIYFLVYSIYQRLQYSITDGVIIASKSLDQCLLSFYDKDEKLDLVLPYTTIGIDGTYKIKVAFQEKNNEISDIILIGSKTQSFYGTNFKIIFYSILTFISFILLFYIYRKKSNTELNDK